jgi:hypothetical protein
MATEDIALKRAGERMEGLVIASIEEFAILAPSCPECGHKMRSRGEKEWQCGECGRRIQKVCRQHCICEHCGKVTAVRNLPLHKANKPLIVVDTRGK